MSQSIGIITPKSLTRAAIELAIGRHWQVEHIPRASGRTDLQIQIVGGDMADIYVSIAELDSVMAGQDYAENDDLPEEFRSALSENSFYLVSFNSFSLIKDVMKEVLSSTGFDVGKSWIDDDYGRIIHATVFLEKLTSDPDWDWRL